MRYALHTYELEARGAEFPWAHIEAVPRGGAVSLFHVCTDSLQRHGLLAHVGVRAERVVIPAERAVIAPALQRLNPEYGWGL